MTDDGAIAPPPQPPAQPPAHPAAWLPDGYGNLRWWDGSAWTDHLVPGHPLARPVAPTPVVADTKRRVLAYLIDMLVLAPGFAFAIAGFVRMVTFADDPLGDDPPAGLVLYAIGWLLCLLCLVVNRGIVQGITGKSLGKKVMKLRVVHVDDGRPLGFWWGILRVAIEVFAGVIDVILAFVVEKRQRVGDMAASTMVLNDEDVERVTGRSYGTTEER